MRSYRNKLFLLTKQGNKYLTISDKFNDALKDFSSISKFIKTLPMLLSSLKHKKHNFLSGLNNNLIKSIMSEFKVINKNKSFRN